MSGQRRVRPADIDYCASSLRVVTYSLIYITNSAATIHNQQFGNGSCISVAAPTGHTSLLSKSHVSPLYSFVLADILSDQRSLFDIACNVYLYLEKITSAWCYPSPSPLMEEPITIPNTPTCVIVVWMTIRQYERELYLSVMIRGVAWWCEVWSNHHCK